MRRVQKTEVVSIQPKYLNMAEAMKYMGCGRDMLYRLRNEGAVRCSKIGKMLYFCVADMDRLFENNLMNGKLYELANN